MPLHALFQAFADTGLSHAMRDSTWAFAIIETFHLVGLALLGGTLLVQNLNAAGLGWRSLPPPDVARSLGPVLAISALVMAISGLLLVGSNPMKYYFNDAFRVKIALFALAATASFGVLRLTRARAALPAPIIRLTALVALALWIGVALAGRLIGLL